MDKVPMTEIGAEMLRAELKQLKGVDRPRIVAAIAAAREHGDLKENAEYHAAREQQSFCEGRVKEIEAKLSMAQIIDVKAVDAGGKIVFGATVDLEDTDGNELTYQIVGGDESNIEQGKISVTSPIARALIGKYEDDEIVVQAPSGDKEYVVVGVRYE